MSRAGGRGQSALRRLYGPIRVDSFAATAGEFVDSRRIEIFQRPVLQIFGREEIHAIGTVPELYERLVGFVDVWRVRPERSEPKVAGDSIQHVDLNARVEVQV